MFFTRKLTRAINNRLIGGPHDFDEEVRYARKIVARWRKRHPKKRLTARVVQDALIDTWNDLHGFKEWRKVEVDLAVIADNVTRRPRRKPPSRKSQQRPKFGWF